MSDEPFELGERVKISPGRVTDEVFTRSGSYDTDLDTVFDLLCDQRRRLFLRFFYMNQFESAELDEVASYITRWESRMGGRSAPSLDDVELVLLHNHLPRLEDAGIIEFERSTATVQYHGSEELERILAAAIDASAVP